MEVLRKIYRKALVLESLLKLHLYLKRDSGTGAFL